MRSDAYITVTCDGCGEETEIQLTKTARGYDERGVNSELENDGWTTVDGKDYRAACSYVREDVLDSE